MTDVRSNESVFCIRNNVCDIAFKHITKIIQGSKRDTPIMLNVIKRTSAHVKLHDQIIL